MLQILLASLLLCLAFSKIQAEVLGKVDIGPAFAHLDILESGKTIKHMDMWGVRGDIAYRLFKCLYLKPTFLYAHGGAAEGGIFTGAVGLGVCLPLKENLLITPIVGGNYCHVWTKIDIPAFLLKNLNENFRSWAPYVGLDFYYTFIPTWRLSLGVQYAWSRTKTTIQHIGKSKSKSEGFSYSALLEHDLSDQWSVNLGGAYNLSLTKEKHGLRGAGVKLGIARWF